MKRVRKVLLREGERHAKEGEKEGGDASSPAMRDQATRKRYKMKRWENPV